MTDSNTNNRPFLRMARLTVTTLDGNQIVINSDGSRDSVRMSFSIHKSYLNYYPNNSEISLWNLSREHRDFLRTRNAQVKLELGWQSTTMHLVYLGDIMNAVTQREGAEIVTKIIAMTNIIDRSVTPLSKTFSTGYPVDKAVKEIAAMVGAEIDEQKIVIGKVMESSMSFCGMAQDALHKLGEKYGFSWSIQDGVFQAINDTFRGFDTATVISAENGTLMQATPILQSQMQINAGVQIVALLIPTVNAGDRISLVSTVNPQLDNTYKAHTIDMTGDTCAADWKMNLQCFYVNPSLGQNQ